VPVVVVAGTDIVAGTEPAALPPTLRLTVKPPVGAALEMSTVPVEVTPPITDVGLIESDTRTGALTVRAAEAVPFRVALMCTV